MIRVTLDHLTLRPVGPEPSAGGVSGAETCGDILELPLGIAGYQAILIDSFV